MDSKALITKQSLDNGIKNDWNDWLRTVKITDENQAVAFHNANPGGKDITEWYNSGEFYKRLGGTGGFSLFEGLFPGDYWKITEKIRSRQDNNGTAQTNEGTDYVMIAGFDLLWGNGDGTDNVTYHHIVCVPGRPDESTNLCFGQHRMNETDTTNGGYKGSQLNTSVIGGVTTTGARFSTTPTASINAQLVAEFGLHLATTRELLSMAMQTSKINAWGEATGGASVWGWASCQACLMSEVEIYGSKIVSSTASDIGNARLQLPVFKFFPIAGNNRSQWYWTKAVGSSAGFCVVGDHGNVADNNASFAAGGVRPRFVLKA